MRFHCATSLLVLGVLVFGRCSGADADTVTSDEQMLRAANLLTDGPALLGFFRKHTLTDADRERIQLLIKQLGDRAFRAREKAGGDLVDLGPKTIPLLRPALKSPDREVARRAADCISRLENGGKNTAVATSPDLLTAAARLLAVRKPAGTAEVLLEYLPFADQEVVIEEIQTALSAVAVREGKPEPVLLRSLTAVEPLRRGLAGAALARASTAEHRTAVRKLLQDTVPVVRLRVGLALAAARDKEAVPALINLLGQLPPEQAWPVEDLLRRLAEDRAPAAPLGTDPDARTKCRDAWVAWWRDRGAGIDLAVLERSAPRLGYTLMVFPDWGKVMELDRDGKVRWQVSGCSSPFHAQVLAGDRVLVAEYSGRVTERNLKGEILWQVQVQGAMQCQRLANGNTFIVSPKQMLEVDRAGKPTWQHGHDRPGSSLLAARKLRSGQIVVMDSDGVCKKLDAAGKELSRFAVGRVSNNCMEVLPSGHVLVSRWFDGKVTEYDAQGKAVHEVQCQSPFSAYRLPNGNTLVACHEPAQVVELDRLGKVVWEHKGESANHRPWFASRR